MYIIAEKYNCLKYCVYSAKTRDLLESFITLARRILFVVFPDWILFCQASYLLFLSLFSYTLLVGFSEHTDWQVLLVYSWVFTLMLDQIREVRWLWLNLKSICPFILYLFLTIIPESYNWTFSVARHLQLCTQPLCIHKLVDRKPISSLQLLNGIDENKTYFGQKYARERPSVLQVYFRDKWNYFDVTILCFFVIAVVLSFVPSYTAEEFARVFHAISLVAFFMRILKTFSAIEELGPKLWMISAMVAIKI